MIKAPRKKTAHTNFFQRGLFDGLTAHIRLFDSSPGKIVVKKYSSRGLYGDWENLGKDMTRAFQTVEDIKARS